MAETKDDIRLSNLVDRIIQNIDNNNLTDLQLQQIWEMLNPSYKHYGVYDARYTIDRYGSKTFRENVKDLLRDSRNLENVDPDYIEYLESITPSSDMQLDRQQLRSFLSTNFYNYKLDYGFLKNDYNKRCFPLL